MCVVPLVARLGAGKARSICSRFCSSPSGQFMPHVVSESPRRVWESEIRASWAGPAIYVRYNNFIFVLVSMSSFSGYFVSWKFRILFLLFMFLAR